MMVGCFVTVVNGVLAGSVPNVRCACRMYLFAASGAKGVFDSSVLPEVRWLPAGGQRQRVLISSQ